MTERYSLPFRIESPIGKGPSPIIPVCKFEALQDIASRHNVEAYSLRSEGQLYFYSSGNQEETGRVPKDHIYVGFYSRDGNIGGFWEEIKKTLKSPLNTSLDNGQANF